MIKYECCEIDGPLLPEKGRTRTSKFKGGHTNE